MVSIVQDNFPIDLTRKLRHYVFTSHNLKNFRDAYKAIDLWHDTGPPFDELLKWVKENIPSVSKRECLSAWCFLYEPECEGVPIHADDGCITVNIWLTPDEHIIDRNKNGLIVYNLSAPKSWPFSEKNGNPTRIQKYIDKAHASRVVVPYSYRRIVVFPSRHFHTTNKVHTKKGVTKQRLSCTLIFG